MTRDELKEIINECINEVINENNITINESSCPVQKYYYNKKIITIPQELKKEMNKTYTYICKYIDAMQGTKEYKDIMQKIIDNKVLNSSCKNKKLYSDSYYEIYDVKMKNDKVDSIKVYINISAYWMTQDAFYYKYDKNKILASYTDKFFKSLKEDKNINNSNPYFKGMYNGDDFWGWSFDFEYN